MKYHDIEKCSLVNGSGIRVVLWVSGCEHHCKGCQNPVTWDPDDGLEFDVHALHEITERMDRDYCDGITLSGGDPMYPDNRKTILYLVQFLRNRYGDTKTIWMYTGYTMPEIADSPILDYVDVVVDGPFVEEKADVNYMWAGSTNQKIWRKVDGQWVADSPMYANKEVQVGDNKNQVSCGC